MGGAEREREVTLETMAEKGWELVRGGPWCRVKLARAPSDLAPFVNRREGEVETPVADVATRPANSVA